jgi:polyisoprenoid-binding protein YceI
MKLAPAPWLRACRKSAPNDTILKRIYQRRVIAAIGLFSVGNTSLAAPVTWHTDPVGTSMELSFDHAKLIEVTTLISAVSGVAVIDDQDISKFMLNITANINSVLSYNDRWPRELRSEKFFDAASTPLIMFESTKLVRSGSGYKVLGRLTMHGVTQPAEFFMTKSKILVFRGQSGRGITLTGEVDWHRFGMTYQDEPDLLNNPEYGKSFKIRINIELSDGPPRAARKLPNDGAQ